MQNILVSIIIPIYKVEPYIIRCIDSVLNQTYRELEVILVDDCSPDNSMTMARERIEQSSLSKDLQFIYLRHEKNKGLSAARNTGINSANGKYVFFLDSDDEITPDCLEKLEYLAEKYHEVDIVQGNIKTNDKVLKYYLDFSNRNFPEYNNEKQWIIDNMLGHNLDEDYTIPTTAWNKLIKLTLIHDYKMYFKEGIIHEDEHWRLMNYNHISSIAFCEDYTYCYYSTTNSITNNPRKFENSFISWMSIYKDFIPIITKDNLYYKYFFRILKKRQKQISECNNNSCNKAYQQMLKCFLQNNALPQKVRIASAYLLLPKMFFIRYKILKWILS